MELCGLPKARPIIWSGCPAFQRHHRSVICAAESLTRFPWAIDTTSEKKIYIRWCCTDLLRPPQLLAEKTLEVDFFKGALQKIEARRQRNSCSGEMASTTRSEK